MERLKKIIRVFLLLAAYVEVYGLFHKGVGSGNYFQDENDLSLFANIWLPFYYYLFFMEKGKLNKMMLFLGILLALAVNVISYSRGGFVGLVCVAIVLWLLSPRKLTSLLVLAILGMLFIFLANTIIAPREYKQAHFWNEMGTITDTESGTAGERIESWKAAWRMFVHNPLGVGGGNFIVRFPEYQTDYFQKNMWGRAAHSLWFTLASELGLVGVVLYGLMLRQNYRDVRSLKRSRELLNNDEDKRYIYFISNAFLASLAGFFTSGTFLSVLYYPHYWYMTTLIVAARKIATDETSRYRPVGVRNTLTAKIAENT